jgi:uncharacterized membrane protein YczE
MATVDAVITRRLVQLIVGLAVFGLGSGLMVQSDLGNPPWDVFHEGFALSTPLSIGVAAIVTSFVVLLLWIPLREKPGPGTIANAVLVGVFIDLTVLTVETPEHIGFRIALMLGGVLLVGVGSGLYIGVRLGPGPRDGLMTGLAKRGLSLRVARTGVEAAAMVVGWMLGGTVGIGTLVFALGIGPLVHTFLPRFDLGGTARLWRPNGTIGR